MWTPAAFVRTAQGLEQRAHVGFTYRRNPWAKTTKLVAKPDQLIKRRGKAGWSMSTRR